MWDVLSGVAEVAWDVLSGAAKMAWDVLSGVTKTAWDVLSGVANWCGMFCPGWQKMAWDVLSRDVLSYIPHRHPPQASDLTSHKYRISKQTTMFTHPKRHLLDPNASWVSPVLSTLWTSKTPSLLELGTGYP